MMLTRAPRNANSDDVDLCVRAAWLHYGAGLTQGQVAKRLRIPSLKAHRLIARANKEGLVRFSIDGDISECLRLEDAICQRFGVKFWEVCRDPEAEAFPLQTLAMGAAGFWVLS